MTVMHSIIRRTGNVFNIKEWFALNKACWTTEKGFGSKSEISAQSSQVKIPSPPKRPMSAYLLFCREHRKNILKDKPYLGSAEQIKILAGKWNSLTEEMKKPYEESARHCVLMYGEEHKKFYESLTEEQKEELARLKALKLKSRRILRHKKILRESGFPKPHTTAYALFVQAEAKKQPSIKNLTDFIKRVAEVWKTLPEETKKIYENKAEEDRLRYVRELKEWRTKMLFEGDKKVLEAYQEVKGKSLDIDETDIPLKKKAAQTEKKWPKENAGVPKN